MTTPETPERDAALDRAWREHSAENPAPQLDAAILAAAHRAVGSTPQDAAKPAGEAGQPARAATGPQRWWMPLAAAATIGAVALGILQVAPPEQPMTAPTVSDMPATSKLAIDTLQQEQGSEAPRAMSETSRAPTARDAGRARALAESAAPPAKLPPATAPVIPSEPAARVVTPIAADSAISAAAPMAAAPQPFPAQRKSETTDQALASERAAPARMAAERDESRQRNDVAQPSAPAATGAVALSKSMARTQAAPASAADIDAAIVRIRRLYDDGKLADAAKELVALRVVVKDADQRLPPELRAWAATVKP